MAHPDGERGHRPGRRGGRGAHDRLDAARRTPLEEVAPPRPAGAPTWFQLYRLHSGAHTDDLARRAGRGRLPRARPHRRPARCSAAGCATCANDFALPAGPAAGQPPGRTATGPRCGTCRRRPGPSTTSPGSASSPACRSWSRACSAATTPPRCVQAGASAVWVSTHGGRQVDPAVASAHALPEVVAAVGRRGGGLRRRRHPVGLRRAHRPRPGRHRRVRRPAHDLGARDRRRRRASPGVLDRPRRGAGAHDDAVRPRRRPVGAPRHRRPGAIASTRAVTGAIEVGTPPGSGPQHPAVRLGTLPRRRAQETPMTTAPVHPHHALRRRHRLGRVPQRPGR